MACGEVDDEHAGPNRAIMFGHRISEYKAFLVVEFDQTEKGADICVKGRNENAAERFIPVFA